MGVACLWPVLSRSAMPALIASLLITATSPAIAQDEVDPVIATTFGRS